MNKINVNKENNYDQVIFLEVGGVLNSNRSLAAFGNPPNIGVQHSWKKMDDVAVRLVRGLSNAANAPIVLSSTWRVGDHYKYFAQYFNLNVVDKTCEDSDIKGNQIKKWLQANPHVVNYVILDIIEMLPEQLPFLVRINSDNGIMFNDLDYAAKILGINSENVRNSNKN